MCKINPELKSDTNFNPNNLLSVVFAFWQIRQTFSSVKAKLLLRPYGYLASVMSPITAGIKNMEVRYALILGIEETADREMDWAEMAEKPASKEKPGSKKDAAKVQTKEQSKDQAADDDKLQKLAETRADSVKNYLIEKGKLDAKRRQSKPAKINSTTPKIMAVWNFTCQRNKKDIFRIDRIIQHFDNANCTSATA